MKRKSFFRCIAVTAAAFMMTAAPSFGVSAQASGLVKIDKTSFPDDNFRSYVLSEIDTDGDSLLSDKERSGVTAINVESRNISSLKGIGYFSNLKKLYCADNSISSLDLSGNKKLEELSVGRNSDGSSSASDREVVKITDGKFGNPLSSLDLSKLSELKILSCSNNKLEKLNVSKNKKLSVLICSNNRLKALDLSKNTELTVLDCSDNEISYLDLSVNRKLRKLNTDGNRNLVIGDPKTNDRIGTVPVPEEERGVSSEPDSIGETAPAKPAKASGSKPNVKITFSSGKVTLKWDAVKGASKYRLCQFDKNGKGKVLKEFKSTSITIKNLKPNVSYRYGVSACVNGKWTSVSTSDILDITVR